MLNSITNLGNANLKDNSIPFHTCSILRHYQMLARKQYNQNSISYQWELYTVHYYALLVSNQAAVTHTPGASNSTLHICVLKKITCVHQEPHVVCAQMHCLQKQKPGSNPHVSQRDEPITIEDTRETELMTAMCYSMEASQEQNVEGRKSMENT